MVILSLLCVALASLILRACLTLRGQRPDSRLSALARIVGGVGLMPVILFRWTFDIAAMGVLAYLFITGS